MRYPHPMTVKAIPVVIVCLILTACTPQTEPLPVVTSTFQARENVEWADYADGTKENIDELEDAGDCASLQTEFDTADANNDATRERAGHNNAHLMQYIWEAQGLAGCF